MASHSAEPYWRKCLSQTWFPLASGISTIITGLYAVKTADPFLTTFGVVSGIATVGGAMHSPPAIQMLCRVGACLKSLATSITSAIIAIVVFISAVTNVISAAVLKNAPRMGAIILMAWATTMSAGGIEQRRPPYNNPIIPMTFPPTASHAPSHSATTPSPRYEAYQATTTGTDYTNGYRSQDTSAQFRQHGSPTIHAPPMASIMPDDEDMNPFQGTAMHPSATEKAPDDVDPDLTRYIPSPTANAPDVELDLTQNINYREADSTQTTRRRFGSHFTTSAKNDLNNYLSRIHIRPEYDTNVFGPQHQPTWTSVVYLNGNEYGRGLGGTKMAAEVAAATQTLGLLAEVGVEHLKQDKD